MNIYPLSAHNDGMRIIKIKINFIKKTEFHVCDVPLRAKPHKRINDCTLNCESSSFFSAQAAKFSELNFF